MVINLTLKWNGNDSLGSPYLFTTSADGSTIPSRSENFRKNAVVTGKVPDRENLSKWQSGKQNSQHAGLPSITTYLYACAYTAQVCAVLIL
jgi:hypothetical protein